MATVPRHQHTVEEYFEFERRSNSKAEYFAGGIFAMAGATERHVLIASNAVGELRSLMKGRNCRSYSSDMRLKVEATGLYTYPDAMVICGPTRLADGRRDVVMNPMVIVEVLSPSTETYDRGEKFEHCRQIESLRDYLLVSQDVRRVERRTRLPSGSWRSDHVIGAGVVRLESISCDLRLDELYADIDFTDFPAGHESDAPG